MLIEKYLFIALVGAAFLTTLWAAVSDWRSLKIPNYISLIIIAIYPAVVLLSPVQIPWISGLMVAAVMFGIGFLLFVLGSFGGGDVKLLVALSLWAGQDKIFPFLVAVVLAGGVLVLALLVKEAFFGADGLSKRGRIKAALRAKMPVPYGVAIAAGSLVIFGSYAGISENFG